ncbi:MAG TPA: hypothetical protein VK681_39020 [Reyranella sp.]|nr:hypothetical protein [Reyranella sp.]
MPNVRWTLDRAFDVIEKSVFALRNLPGPLAELQQRIERAKGLPDEALPTLAKALCRACLEGSESSAALAVFHETDSTEDLQRALKEKVEHHGAEEIAIAAIQAELERRAS